MRIATLSLLASACSPQLSQVNHGNILGLDKRWAVECTDELQRTRVAVIAVSSNTTDACGEMPTEVPTWRGCDDVQVVVRDNCDVELGSIAGGTKGGIIAWYYDEELELDLHGQVVSGENDWFWLDICHRYGERDFQAADSLVVFEREGNNAVVTIGVNEFSTYQANFGAEYCAL